MYGVLTGETKNVKNRYAVEVIHVHLPFFSCLFSDPLLTIRSFKWRSMKKGLCYATFFLPLFSSGHGHDEWMGGRHVQTIKKITEHQPTLWPTRPRWTEHLYLLLLWCSRSVCDEGRREVGVSYMKANNPQTKPSTFLSHLASWPCPKKKESRFMVSLWA